METLVSTKTSTKWVLDLAHSELNFKVKHLMISNVKGSFRKFEGSINGKDLTASPVSVKIDASSIFTNDDARDGHLKNADFFDVDHHKDIVFNSTSFKKVDAENYKLTGKLTIKGISKEVTLDAEFGGINKDPWGNEKAAFSFNGKINRKDWGLNWNAALESGGVLVSDEVHINGDVQLMKTAVE